MAEQFSLTVIGGGKAGLSLIEYIRQHDESLPITLIDKNQYSVNKCINKYSSHPFISTKSCCAYHQWAEQFNVTFVCDRVERINPQRKKIYCKEGSAQSYKKLVIATGVQSKKMEIKGDHREGFFYVTDSDPFFLKSMLKFVDEACVLVSSVVGLQYAALLRQANKSVTVICPSLDFLGEHREVIKQWLASKDIVVYEQTTIIEVIGERMVKAVKLDPLKVLSAQLVVVDSGLEQNVSFFDEPALQHDLFFCQYDDVIFLGDVIDKSISQNHFFIYQEQRLMDQATVISEYLLKGVYPQWQPQESAVEDIIQQHLGINLQTQLHTIKE